MKSTLHRTGVFTPSTSVSLFPWKGSCCSSCLRGWGKAGRTKDTTVCPEHAAHRHHLIQQPCGCEDNPSTADQHTCRRPAGSTSSTPSSLESEERSGKGAKLTRPDLFPRPIFYPWLQGQGTSHQVPYQVLGCTWMKTGTIILHHMQMCTCWEAELHSVYLRGSMD